MNKIKFLIFLCAVSIYANISAQPAPDNKTVNYSAYLFVYFIGNKVEEESLHMAISQDGFNYFALNNDLPVLDSKTISSSGGIRDPHILRGNDGKTFYMVMTDMTSSKGWSSNRAMVLLKSSNLVDWKSTVVNIPNTFPEFKDVDRVWAPQTIFDSLSNKYMIYFSLHRPNVPDKIYYAYANDDFTALESAPKQLFFSPTNNACIDGDIIYFNGKYHLFFKTEDQKPGIKKAVSNKLTEGYVLQNDNYLQQTTEAVEGAGVFRLNNSDTWILMYDVYMKGKYQFTQSKDLENFKVVDNEISMDFHPRHGTVMSITRSELKTLVQKWGMPKSFPEINNNPVLDGYFADPEILYSNKTKKYYLYPTSDGFNNWSGTYFKTFSSSNLKDWKDEGIILDLPKDVSWANRNAWAPCIIEKKLGKTYKYYYYFTGAQKIGVAVSDNPTGPFKDSGKALIDKKPDGIKGGQEIDPDVFADPKTNKSYLYWGNGYMAVAELNKDMVSIRDNSIKIITPADKTFREGTYVFYRKGIYYFLWSEDDTRSENYRVRYGTSNSPTGPINIPKNNLILQKDSTLGIYGTGHNSVLQIPGKDEWYIVYHRFNYPNGIKMGNAAGYNREVCIDKLEFDEKGNIKAVKVSHKGIELH
jgi:arabinoxylan arabinofuranohydrolase